MRVIFIQKSTDRGGAKRSLIESLSTIRGDDTIEASVLVGSQGQLTRDCDAIGISHLTTPLPEWRKLFDRLKFSSAMRMAAGLVAPQRPDWIISNEMWWAPHAAFIAKYLGCKSAVILRDGIATIPKALQYKLYQNDLILPVSSTIADALRQDPQCGPRVHVMFNSVSLAPPQPAAFPELDAKLASFSAVTRWLLVLGKVCERKNQAAAVRVLRNLLDAGHADAGLILAGDIDPEYRATMDVAITNNRVADRVVMLGNFEGIGALFERSHSVLLPSFREGLPRSLVEGILADRPSFSFPCEGVEDIYGEHLAAFVSSESTSESLFAVIQRAWSHPEPSAVAFAKVRRKVIDRFSPQAHLARLTSLLTGSGAGTADSAL